MFKVFVSLFILLTAISWAEAGDSEAKKVRLQAERISGDKENLYANGHITLHYADTLFMADSAQYDKVHKRLVIQGAVRIINPDGSRGETDKVTLNVAQDRVVFEKFFYADEKDVWLSSVTAQKQKDCYRLKQAMFSTCAVTNPDWHLGFSEADYNATSKYIKLKDIKFYVGETPIFYFPYLAFSTSRERSSGLLMPRFGYNTKEGFIYEQPIFWAISPGMDMEFNPQIRTDRSLGLYTTLRFADSAYSEGLLRVGYFEDDEAYATKYNLKNSSHYGLEGKYESSDFLKEYKPEGYEDGLYANVVLFNDIDYLNLQKSKLAHLSDSHLKESRLNYLLYNDSYYVGLNAKYFLDANQESNSKTLQEFPSLRWHKFNSSFGIDHFSYSIDAKLSHYTRHKGTASKQLEFSVPMVYQLDFLEDYLKIELSEEVYGFIGEFSKGISGQEDYSTLMATHKLKLYSDMIKPYQSGLHTVEWSIAYEKQDYLGDGLLEYTALDPVLRKDFLSRKPFDDRVTLAWNQYWHSNTLSLEAKQRISQVYYPDRDEAWGDLKHELEFTYGEWSVSNLFKYSFAYDNFSEMSNKLLYQKNLLSLELEHFWRKDLEAGAILTNEIAFDMKYQYSKEVKLFSSMTYDLEQKESKKWRSGILYDKGCWSVEFSYNHDTKPILEKDGGGSINNDTFLVRLNLVPFGESEIRQ